MQIKYIKRKDIDKLKWDSCIHYATNSNIFGYTWYLDQVAKEWDGLVEGDYESVFPLFEKELKLGIKSLYQPELIPKAGLYSIHALSQARLDLFMDKIQKEYDVIDIHFSDRIPLSSTTHFANQEFEDYQLLLREDWENIYNNYSQKLKNAIQEIDMNQYIISSSVRLEEVADFYLKYTPHATEKKKHTYLRIMYNLLHRGTGFLSAITDKNNHLVAAIFFVFSQGKLMSLLPIFNATEQGQKCLWKITDLMIQSNSNKPMFFDFNISMGNIGAKEFGAQKIIYKGIHKNQLKGFKKWWVGK